VSERLEELKKKIERTSEKVEPSVESLLGKTVFKAKITDQYRITIPEAEREAADFEIGDLVQVSLRKVGK